MGTLDQRLEMLKRELPEYTEHINAACRLAKERDEIIRVSNSAVLKALLEDGELAAQNEAVRRAKARVVTLDQGTYTKAEKETITKISERLIKDAETCVATLTADSRADLYPYILTEEVAIKARTICDARKHLRRLGLKGFIEMLKANPHNLKSPAMAIVFNDLLYYDITAGMNNIVPEWDETEGR